VTSHISNKVIVLSKGLTSPIVFLVVKELPKGALVEKQVLVHSGRCQVIDDGEVVVENMTPEFKQGSQEYENGCTVHWEFSWFRANNGSSAIIYLKGDFSDSLTKLKQTCSSMSPILASTLAVRYFYCPGVKNMMNSLAHSIFGGSDLPPITPIPCRAISSSMSDNWDIAFCIVGESGVL
jgi:diphthine-ammonia ligase